MLFIALSPKRLATARVNKKNICNTHLSCIADAFSFILLYAYTPLLPRELTLIGGVPVPLKNDCPWMVFWVIPTRSSSWSSV